MALKVLVESLDDVQDELKPYYTQTDAGFVLSVDGVDEHPEVRGLKGAYQSEKTRRAEISKKAGALEARLADLEDKPAPTQKDDAEMVRLRAAIEAERDEYRAKYEAAEKQVYSLTVENTLDSMIRDAGITEPAFAKAAKTLLSQGVKLADGRPVVETDMGPLPLADHVKRWVSGEGKVFVSRPTGGGASGSTTPRGGKTISAAELETMTPREKAAFFKAHPGVTIGE